MAFGRLLGMEAGSVQRAYSVFRVKIPSRKVERLASLNGGTDRDSLGLMPDDSPLIARFIGAQEIYALTVNCPGFDW